MLSHRIRASLPASAHHARSILLTLSLCTAPLVTTATHATEWELNKDKSQLLFKAGGFVKASGGFRTFDAQFKGDLITDPSHVVIHATVDTASVATGSSLQDQYLKGDAFFDVQRFPKAEFNSTQIIVHDLRHATIQGNLIIKGISKPISFDTTFDTPTVDPTTHTMSITSHGSITINRDDWGMDTFIPGVSNQITVTVNNVIRAKAE